MSLPNSDKAKVNHILWNFNHTFSEEDLKSCEAIAVAVDVVILDPPAAPIDNKTLKHLYGDGESN